MDQQENSSIQSGANRQKLNKESDQSSAANSEVTTVFPVNAEQTADILKLDFDCCEEVFEYLWIEDLVSVGKTCKRLQQVAGYHFQQNYPYSEIKCEPLGIQIWNYSQCLIINVEHFAAFIQTIQIVDGGLNAFLNAQSKFHRLKQMELHDSDLTKFDNWQGITNKIWNKLEVLQLHCDLSKSFRKIIDLCVNLRYLKVTNCGGEWNWPRQKYPTLEYLKIDRGPINGIVMFLKLNPNIRKFATSAEFLWDNQFRLMAANIKLDILAVKEGHDNFSNECLCYVLNELHDRHFFKKLYWKKETINQEEINQLATVNGLYKLNVRYSKEPITIEALTNLEEICMLERGILANVEEMATRLINLKRIHVIRSSSIDSIMPFIRRSVQMQTIKINFRTEPINLLALNRERMELPGAQKITMYVREEIYLATKWTHGETDFEFIRLKRQSSYKW